MTRYTDQWADVLAAELRQAIDAWEREQAREAHARDVAARFARCGLYFAGVRGARVVGGAR